MIYGYVRVSTDKQDNENQRFEITNYCKIENIQIDEWVEDIISGTKDPNKRNLGGLLLNVQKGDTIITSEISRLGRSLFMIMGILKLLTEKEIQCKTVKGNFNLDGTIQSQVLAFAFGLAAEIERDLISMRTKEALKRKKADGFHLGRPVGCKSSHYKLDDREDEIIDCLNKGLRKRDIIKVLNTSRTTLNNKLKNMGINYNDFLKEKRPHKTKPTTIDSHRASIIKMLKRDKTITYIADSLGYSYNSTHEYILKNNLNRYKPTQPLKKAEKIA